MTDFSLGDLSTYNNYLNSTFRLFRNIPLSDTERNTLILRLYRETDVIPRVLISRRSFVHLSGNIGIQDVLNIEGPDKNVTLSAEFTPAGELISSPKWEGDPLFESITREMTTLQDTSGSRLSVEVNYGAKTRFTSSEGAWVSTGSSIEGQKRGNKEAL